MQQGVLNCAVRINQGEHFLCFNAQAGAVLMTPSAQPDRQLVDAAASEQHPLRWKRRPRAWTAPEHVWLNPPAKADEAAQTRKAA
ncbi:hypothetical protein [Rhodocyclus purpureus]|uniref:hypothetical protein n=1 Tax=Rhodocyclus purpureus TaxID=1067 RepID=UPI001A918F3F|nr:hypothetical protein [Rhodocyclus purpureus]